MLVLQAVYFKRGTKKTLVLLIYFQTSPHLTGTFSLIPNAAASASHLSTLRKKAWWWTSTSSPSPSQSLMTNTPSNTSLTLAMLVRHLFVIYRLVFNVLSKITHVNYSGLHREFHFLW